MAAASPYLELVASLAEVDELVRRDVGEARARHETTYAQAAAMIPAVERLASQASASVDTALEDARSALATIGMANLMPRKCRPVQFGSEPSTSIDHATSELAASGVEVRRSVNELQAVRAGAEEAVRRERAAALERARQEKAEAERLEREAAEGRRLASEAQARRRQFVRRALLAGMVALVVVIGVVGILTITL
jgi:hypothetical protein